MNNYYLTETSSDGNSAIIQNGDETIKINIANPEVFKELSSYGSNQIPEWHEQLGGKYKTFEQAASENIKISRLKNATGEFAFNATSKKYDSIEDAVSDLTKKYRVSPIEAIQNHDRYIKNNMVEALGRQMEKKARTDAPQQYKKMLTNYTKLDTQAETENWTVRKLKETKQKASLEMQEFRKKYPHIPHDLTNI